MDAMHGTLIVIGVMAGSFSLFGLVFLTALIYFRFKLASWSRAFPAAKKFAGACTSAFIKVEDPSP